MKGRGHLPKPRNDPSPDPTPQTPSHAPCPGPSLHALTRYVVLGPVVGGYGGGVEGERPSESASADCQILMGLSRAKQPAVSVRPSGGVHKVAKNRLPIIRGGKCKAAKKCADGRTGDPTAATLAGRPRDDGDNGRNEFKRSLPIFRVESHLS